MIGPSLPVISPDPLGLAIVGSLALGLVVFVSQLLPTLLKLGLNWLGPPGVKEIYATVVQPHRGLLGITITLGLLDVAVVLVLGRWFPVPWFPTVEPFVTLAFTFSLGWFASRVFREYFGTYLLDNAVRAGRKVNSELLVLAKFFANFAIVVILSISFGQTHNINVFGVVASLGISGIAIAFAAQKVLEQLLGGIVIYVDRPFGVDDYIGLPDGTYGRVESIGLRSTKIRISGKGTLAIVPNNAIIQSTVENFTGAKKVMAILYLSFHRPVPEDEQALIRQVILESSNEVAGLDARSTDITFRTGLDDDLTQVQVTFFILGAGQVSMDLRRQLLDIANQNLTQRLKQYGISFQIEEPTIYVDSPITI